LLLVDGHGTEMVLLFWVSLPSPTKVIATVYSSSDGTPYAAETVIGAAVMVRVSPGPIVLSAES
jgi:hypothetical protein